MTEMPPFDDLAAIPMPHRQLHAIELQREIAALPPGAAFHQSCISLGDAVKLLALIAASDSDFAADARTVLDEWRRTLATPEQVASVVTGNEIEVGGGAVVSEADDGSGFWISTWTWIDAEYEPWVEPTRAELIPQLDDEK